VASLDRDLFHRHLEIVHCPARADELLRNLKPNVSAASLIDKTLLFLCSF
jgi:hypothetical protein